MADKFYSVRLVKDGNVINRALWAANDGSAQFKAYALYGWNIQILDVHCYG